MEQPIEKTLREQAIAMDRFVSIDLEEAIKRLAARRGETMEDVMVPGWSRTATTEDEGFDTSEHVSMTARYDIDDYGEANFVYEMVKSTEGEKDLKECTVAQVLEIHEIIDDPNNEDLSDEQREGLKALMSAYLNGELPAHETVAVRNEIRLVCKGYPDGGVAIERSLALYVDDTLVSATSVGNADIYEELPVPDDDDTNATDVLILPEEVEHDIDLSTPTLEDIAELTRMLQMLGLHDWPAVVPPIERTAS